MLTNDYKAKVVVPSKDDHYNIKFGGLDHILETDHVADVVQQREDCYTKDLDCAFALLNDESIKLDASISTVGGVQGIMKVTRLNHLFDQAVSTKSKVPVFFCGCTSGLKETTLRGTDTVTIVLGKYVLKKQLRLDTAAKPGDSGSVVVLKEGNKAIGLINVSTPEGKKEYAAANPIEKVLKFLKVRIATVEDINNRAKRVTAKDEERVEKELGGNKDREDVTTGEIEGAKGEGRGKRKRKHNQQKKRLSTREVQVLKIN